MVEESEILKKLLIDEKDLTKELELIVVEATKIFRIEKSSGRIIFNNFEELNDKQRILVVLAGKFYANRIKIIEKASLSLSEIAKELGRPSTTLSKPLGQIVKLGFVEKLPKGENIIAHHRIKEIFDKILITKK